MSKQQPPNKATARQAAPDTAPDSTERKRTQEGQRQSEEKYRKLFQMMNTEFSLCEEAIRDEAGKMIVTGFTN